MMLRNIKSRFVDLSEWGQKGLGEGGRKEKISKPILNIGYV